MVISAGKKATRDTRIAQGRERKRAGSRRVGLAPDIAGNRDRSVGVKGKRVVVSSRHVA